MADKSKFKLAETLRVSGIARKSYSRDEICARNGIGIGHYRNLQKRGLGPRETPVGDTYRITDVDEIAWLELLASTGNTAA